MACRVILMMEDEQPEGLSARKLVVETVKHNVLTAYTADEGIDLLRRFPNIDAVLVHARVVERQPNVLARVKMLAPRIPIILASPGESRRWLRSATRSTVTSRFSWSSCWRRNSRRISRTE